MNIFQKLKALYARYGKGVEQSFNLDFDSPGHFTYEEDGFTFDFGDGPTKKRWLDIERMVAYKADLLTYDELRLRIEFAETYMLITEDTLGFFPFVSKTKQVFPSIPNDWDTRILHPPFAANETVIYQKNTGRSPVDS